MAIALSILTIIAAVIPVVLRMLAERKQETDALTNRSIDELHTGTDRVRQPPPV